jgi:hypothetical protein
MANVGGYVRVWTRKNRGVYQHRLVMARSCKEWCYYPLGKDGLPKGFHVHHVDNKRDHNCIENLILLQDCIHLKSKTRLKHPYTGRFIDKGEWEREMGLEGVPEWVYQDG